MAQTIQIRRGTGSAVPSSLAAGELAINTDTGKFYYGNGSAVSSDFRVDSITAENYIVCSSVSNITTQTLSGSTQFGDSADDTHQFTGNITASGHISSSGTVYTNKVDFNPANSYDYIAHDDTRGVHIKSNNSKITLIGNVTASGNISSSGTIKGNDYVINEKSLAGLENSDTELTLGYGMGSGRINLGRKNATPSIFTNGAITASGGISASGTIFTDTLSSPINNLTFNSDIVTVAAGTDGDATLVISADTDNNDEDDNARLWFKQDGDITEGAIQMSSNKLNIISNVSGIGGISFQTGTTNNTGTIDPATGATERMNIASDGTVTVVGNLDLNGNVIGDGATDISGIDTITSTGNISSSGYVYADRLYTGNRLAATAPSADKLRIGYDSGLDFVEYGKDTNTSHRFYGAAITASGHISASGHIFAEEIHIDNQEAIASNNDYLLINESGLFSGGVAINRSNMTLPITMYGAVTASSHISASGNVIAAAINSHDHSIGFWNGTSISLGYENHTPIQIGKLNNPTTIIGNITASGNIIAGGTMLAGWHGSTTRIKILVSDFIPDDIGRPAMIDDTGSDRWLESHGTGKLFASLPIPSGFKATHVHIYGSGTSALEVSEMDINSKTVTSKGTGNIGTELDITDVTSTTTNYLLLELAQASGEEVYGGYVTITYA